MKYFNLVIYLLLIFIGNAGAQTDTSSTIPDNTVFNGRRKVGLNREAAYFENVIKFEPTMLLRNCIFFGYDHYIKNNFAVSVGAGYSYDFDPILKANSLNSIMFVSEALEKHMTFSEIVSVRKKFDSGFAAQIAGRGYFERDDYLPGGYAEINYRFCLYNFSFTGEDFYRSTGYILKNNQPVNVTSSALTASYGYQVHTTGKVKLVHDFVVGFGYRISTINKILKSDTFFNTAIGAVTGQPFVKEGTMYETKVAFGGYTISFGYTIGFGF
ncbi:MAG: hypothetical protein V4635_07105 [Bacteroidota bacterium]